MQIMEGIELFEITSSSMNLPSLISHEPGPLRKGEIYTRENFGMISIDFQMRRVNIELHGLNEGVVRSETINF